jgi:hypothetical protein
LKGMSLHLWRIITYLDTREKQDTRTELETVVSRD